MSAENVVVQLPAILTHFPSYCLTAAALVALYRLERERVVFLPSHEVDSKTRNDLRWCSSMSDYHLYELNVSHTNDGVPTRGLLLVAGMYTGTSLVPVAPKNLPSPSKEEEE